MVRKSLEQMRNFSFCIKNHIVLNHVSSSNTNPHKVIEKSYRNDDKFLSFIAIIQGSVLIGPFFIDKNGG